MEMKKMEEMGAMIGIFLIIIVLVLGALYFTKQRYEKSEQFKEDINKALATTTPTTSSDEISSLESDASSMNFDNLGSDVNNL